MTKENEAWVEKFEGYAERIAKNDPALVEWFVRDFTEYATHAWDYEPATALMIANRSAAERDAYFSLYLIGIAREAERRVNGEV